MSKAQNAQKRIFRTNKSWLDIQYRNGNTVKKPDELENELTYPPEQVNGDILNRVQGSIIGMALGDAVGAHVEFRPQEYLAKNPVEDLRGGGTWGLKKGQFTDDTSMALCLANSLVVCEDFVPYDQLVRYKWWYRHGYMSSTGKCFDIGAATKKSLEEFESRQEKFGKKYDIPPVNMNTIPYPPQLSQFNFDCSQKGVAGNGALMRLAPVPLFFYRYPMHAVEFSGVSGRITHGDQSAYDACRYYGALIVAALKGEEKDKLLAKSFFSDHEHWFDNKPLHPDIMKIAEGSYKKPGGYKDGIRGKGYIVHALEAALWAFNYDENSFEKGVLDAVNLGDDTDTTAAIYGQLAGAYYGYKRLPLKWLEFVYAQKFIQCLSEWIVYEGNIWQPKKSHASIMNNSTPQQQPSANVTSSSTQKPNSNMKTSSERQQGSRSMPQYASNVRSGAQYDSNFQSTPSSKHFRDPTATPNTQPDHLNKQKSDWDSNPNEHFASTDLNAAQYQDFTPSPSTAYFHEQLKTCENVCVWLKGLGEEYAAYRPNFEANMVDGFWLLNYVNEKFLKQYGVKNETHRQKILSHIEKLKRELSA